MIAEILLTAGLLLGIQAQSSFAEDGRFQLIRELNRNTAYPGMALSGNYLYVSDMNESYQSQVHIYDKATLKLVKTITLEHSATGIYPYGTNGVVTLGRKSAPVWASHLTLIKEGGNDFSSEHRVVSDEVISESAVANGRDLLLNEKGTYGVYRMVNARQPLQKLPFEVSGPANDMKVADNVLYVVELRGLFSYGDESIVAFDFEKSEFRRVAEDQQFFGLNGIEVVDEVLFGVEEAGHSVIAVDVSSDQLVDRVAVAEGPSGISKYGKCAVVVSDRTKTLSFLRLESSKLMVVATQDLSEAGDRLKLPRTLAVDDANHAVFVRSSYTCSTCSVTQSSVYRFLVPDTAIHGCQDQLVARTGL